MEEKTIDVIDEVAAEETIDDAGNIKIAQDVIATIAGMAASNIEGIVGMSGGLTDGFAQMLGRKQLTKGVKVEVSDNYAKIDVFIIVKYGFNIAEVAGKAQKAVKESVENMTGMTVSAVNVNVQGISFVKEEEVIEPEVTVD